MSSVTIVPLTNTKSDIKKFVTSAWRFYRGNPFWVPPLISDQVNLIHAGPYHEVGVIQPFLAYRDGKIAGRIIAHYDNRHNEYFKEKRGCVGFFESDNDTGVSRALFGAAEKWLKEKGMSDMQGPFNFTLYDTPGVLMDDYDNIPAVELAYNPPYYPDLYDRLRFREKYRLVRLQAHRGRAFSQAFLQDVGEGETGPGGAEGRPGDTRDQS